MAKISHRIVHFDLKGAPWKVPFLKQVILASKKWGATGCLFEWEDSFPYTGQLVMVGSLGGSSKDGLYAENEIKDILQFTKEIGLEPIQLVQSIGHLEFVLKHYEFSMMREHHLYPSAMCPTRPGASDLIVAMVKQLLATQPDAKFIHIGADEVWHINKCGDCIYKTGSNIYGVDSLFIDHIKAVVLRVQQAYPNIQVLIWDDMLRGMKEGSIIGSEMNKYVIPVAWNYGPVGGFNMDDQMWNKYEKAFSEVWVASAYKGANGGNQMVSHVELYVSNQEAWLRQIKLLKDASSLMVTGIVLTGWSRFDHYATLCELLPVSLPSLASCLRMWTKPENVPKEVVVSDTLPASEWAGAVCAQSIRTLYNCRQRCLTFIDGELVGTWLNAWQVAHQYTTAMQVTPIGNMARQLAHELNILRLEVSSHLSALTGPRSTEEWTQTNVSSIANRLEHIAQTAESRSLLPAPVLPMLNYDR